MNVIKEIQDFNQDERVNSLRLQYERNSFLSSLSVTRREQSHSSFLAELLKEDAFHDMGKLPLQLFLETVLRRALMQSTRLQENPKKEVMFPALKSAILTRTLSMSDIEVDTEVYFNDADCNSGQVDILATCRVRPLQREDGKPVKYLNIIIENKVSAKETDCQTNKYYNHFNAFLKNKGAGKVDVSALKVGQRSLYNLYVYLTPATQSEVDKLQEPESECKEYVQICYQDLLDYVINPLIDSKQISERGRFYLEEYRRSLGVSFEDVETAWNPGIRGRKSNTIVMAIGKKESEELCEFWKAHQELLTAAINEKNRSDDESDADANQGKRTLYEYSGQPFSMGRLVQAVIIDHLPEYTVDEMNDIFGGIVNKIISKDINKSYFEATCETLTKDFCTVGVFKQWTEKRQYKFADFCKKAKELGWYDLKEYKKVPFTPDESLMLVDFYEKHKKLINTAMEIVRRSSQDDIAKEVEALLKRTTSHRDRTTYNVTLHANYLTKRELSWGRLVLAVLQDYVECNDECTSDVLKQSFNLPKNALKQCNPQTTGLTGFFNSEPNWLKLKDGEYMVAIGWNASELKKFINAAKEMSYDIIKSN